MKQSFISPRRAAILMDVGLNYVYRLLYEGKLTARKVGTRWEIDRKSIKAYKRKRNRKKQRNRRK